MPINIMNQSEVIHHLADDLSNSLQIAIDEAIEEVDQVKSLFPNHLGGLNLIVNKDYVIDPQGAKLYLELEFLQEEASNDPTY